MPPVPSASPGEFDSPRIDVALGAILLLALAFRLYRIDLPFVDAHSWRQVTNADIARHFAEGSLNPFLPRVSWGGDNGVVGMEFPLLQWLTGLVWRIAGETAASARLVATAFSMAAVWLIYLLGHRFFGRPAARAAAFLLAISPGAIFFGRSFLSDTPMLAFSIASVLAWDIYFERDDGRWALLAGVMTALAGLVKLPAIVVLGGVAGVAWSHCGWRGLCDRRLVIGVAAALLAIAAWYWYADAVYQRTGLTQAVFRPSGTYPAAIAPGVTFTSISHWATPERLFSADFWKQVMLDRFWGLYLTPYGFLAAILGFWMAFSNSRGLALHLWALPGLALVVIAAEGQFWHEFHTLPLVPPLILYAGLAAAPVFDGAVLARRLPILGAGAGAALAVALVVVSLQTFRGSGVLTNLYRVERPGDLFVAAGPMVRSVTDGAPLITVDYDEAGANSAMMLYYARRQGWSFDVRSISADVIEHLRTTKGVGYFVTSRWGSIRDQKPEVAEYLSQFNTVPLPGAWPHDFRVVNLQ